MKTEKGFIEKKVEELDDKIEAFTDSPSHAEGVKGIITEALKEQSELWKDCVWSQRCDNWSCDAAKDILENARIEGLIK